MNTPSSDSNVSRREFLKTAGAGTALVGASSVLRLKAAEHEAIPKRSLGETGVQVPIIGLGTAPAGHRTRKDAAAFYAECLDRGVTYLDTAPEFAGYGVAQLALGDVLKSRRKEALLVTKCWKADGEEALKLLKQNLRELQTDYADVVYAHSLGSDQMDPKTVTGPKGVIKALEKAQRDGLVRFIGISGHNRPARFLEVIRNFDIQVMMNAVSFVSRHIYDFETKVWPEAHRRGVALVAMKVFGGMVNSSKNPKGGRLSGSDASHAFRYAQSLPDISTVVLGMHDSSELTTNIDWALRNEPLPKDELEILLAHGKKLATEWGNVYGPVV